MTRSPKKVPVVADEAVRLVDLATGKVVPLTVGDALTLGGICRITIADAEGNAMLERLGHAAGNPLAIDGTPVFEVAHFRPRQLVEADGGAYVTLRPFDAYLRRDVEPQLRLARWRQLMTRTRLKTVDANVSRPTGAANVDEVKAQVETPVASVRRQPRAKPRPKAKRQVPATGSRINLFRVSAAAALLVFGSLTLLALWPSADGDASSGPGPAAPVDASDAAVSPAPPPAPVSVTRPSPSTSPEPSSGPAPLASPAPAPAPATVITAPAPAAKPRVVPAPPSTGDRPQATVKQQKRPPQVKWSTADELGARRRLESLQLEANYDPHGARRSLEALGRAVPSGSKIHRDIRHAIGALQ